MPEDSQVILRLEDGSTISRWQNYEINSEFLTPTDGWSFSFTTPTEWKRLRGVCRKDAQIEIEVDGCLQLTGWIDEVKAGCGGTKPVTVNVQGRDILKVLCDANVHPDIPLKGKKIYEVVEATIGSLYPNVGRKVITDNAANREILTGVKGFKKSAKSRKTQTELDYCKGKANEGAFEFLARNLRRFGLWMWSDAEGNIIVSSPDYDQAPCCSIIHREGEKRAKVLDASYVERATQVPSQILVRGKGSEKEFQKGNAEGFVSDPDRKLFVPRYVSHPQCTDDAQAQAYAEQEMTEAKKDAKVYECILRGHSDEATGCVYAVDTIIHVEDDILGVSEDMWVRERTFRRGIDGTTTSLKLVPRGSVVFSDVDHAA